MLQDNRDNRWREGTPIEIIAARFKRKGKIKPFLGASQKGKEKLNID